MREEFSSILIAKDDIEKRIEEMGKEITANYRSLGVSEVVIVAILRGAVVFMSDLIRQIDLPLKIDFMAVSSYGNAVTTSGKVNIVKDIDEDIYGKDVLIVEDIIDTGLTMSELKAILLARSPKSLKICSFLNKPSRRLIELVADYNGFDVPDEFIVGYGLDYAGRYRELPYVAVLDPKVYNSR